MEYKKLSKASKIFEKIQLLDGEIIALDAFAMKIASENLDISLKMSFTEDKPDAVVTVENEIKTMMLTSIMWYSPNSKTESNKNEVAIDNIITENTALMVLGLLLKDKHEKRDSLIKQLEKLTA